MIYLNLIILYCIIINIMLKYYETQKEKSDKILNKLLSKWLYQTLRGVK
jgi:hypothetical protein